MALGMAVRPKGEVIPGTEASQFFQMFTCATLDHTMLSLALCNVQAGTA